MLKKRAVVRVYIKDKANVEKFKFVGLGEIVSRSKDENSSYISRGKSHAYYDVHISQFSPVVNVLRSLASFPRNMSEIIMKKALPKPHKLFNKKMKIKGVHQIGVPKSNGISKLVGTIAKSGRRYGDDVIITPQSEKRNMIQLKRDGKYGLSNFKP